MTCPLRPLLIPLLSLLVFVAEAGETLGEPDTPRTERYFQLKNETDRRLEVWLLYHQAADSGETGWKPVAPEKWSEAPVHELAPGKSMVLEADGKKLAADRVRFWAESETGWHWSRYFSEDLWLVPKDKTGERHYQAADVETFTYTFEPPDRPATLRHYLIQVRNNTSLAITVHGQALHQRVDGTEAWEPAASQTLQPGQTLSLKRPDGWLLHGSQALVWAEDEAGERFRWWQYKDEAVEIGKSEGYRGQEATAALFVFENPLVERAKDVEETEADKRPTYSLVPDQVNVPAVLGTKLAEARAALTKLGFRVAMDGREGPAEEPVLSQNPGAGWQPLTLEVRLSIDVVVPDVVGLEVDEARLALDTNRLAMKLSNGDRRGKILGQEPIAGTFVPPGATVTLFPEGADLPRVSVPDLMGLDFVAAKAELESKALVIKTAGGERWGRVVHQDPTVGAMVPRGTVVTVTMEPPAQDVVSVPDVIGMEYVEARGELEAKGLVIKSATGERQGKVLSQDPVVGVKVARGSVVTVRFPPATDVEKVAVPQVVGMPLGLATAQLAAVGLVAQVVGDPARGAVLNSAPVAGTLVARGSVVILIFPNGGGGGGVLPGQAPVPAVVGLSERSARLRLQVRGLVMQSLGNPGQGPAIDQNPAAGTMVERGTRVLVLFPDGQEMVTVPRVVGMHQEAARQQLESRGLVMQNYGDANQGVAIRQDPVEGTPVNRGSVVQVGFPGLQAKVEVPGVVGMQSDQARSRIEDAGLVFQAQGVAAAGAATAQSPASGTMVKRGSTVVVSFPGAGIKVMVPSVVGKLEPDAKGRLAVAGLQMAALGNPQLGPAIAQQPAANTEVDLGSTVTVTFPGAAGQVIVPSVLGMTRDQAQARLTQAQLLMAAAGDPAPGAVASAQDPGAGSQVNIGTLVKVTYGGGGIPNPVTVPNVLGKRLDEAQSALAAVQLVLVPVGFAKHGVAVNQAPKAGAIENVGSRVSVDFGEMTTVPNVVGATLDQAERALTSARLWISPRGDSTQGIALGQAPVAGTQVKVGTTVNVHFPGDQNRVRLPSVVGMSDFDARMALHLANLKASVKAGDTNNLKVLAQEPSAGQLVSIGTVIGLTFPTDPLTVTVPNVVNKTPEEAAGILRGIGLKMTQVGSPHIGKSTGQSPAEGTSTGWGYPVVVQFPVELVTVPNVLGMTMEEARNTLSALGLWMNSAGWLYGRAIEQDPKAGTSMSNSREVFVRFESGNPVTVPEVVGLSFAEASGELEKVHLNAKRGAGNPQQGRVVRQDPQAGATIEGGMTVTLDFPAGSSRGTVPNVVGKSFENARAELVFSGYDSLGYVGDPTKLVSAQEPEGGAEAEIGTYVVLTFPRGLPPPAQVRVPNVIGLPVRQVQKVIGDLGLTTRIHGNPQAGVATAQSPAAGMLVASGTTVQVTFPGDTVQVAVPNVVGKSTELARKLIEDAGLVFKPLGQAPFALAIRQQPAAGTPAPPGQVVEVSFSITVPNVVGLQLVEARQAITAAGLTFDVRGDPSAGPVLTQLPGAGSFVAAGSTVTAVFPSAAMVPVPNLIGLSPARADWLLKARSLVMQIEGDPEQGGCVAQSPTAGTMVKPGSVVMLTFPSNVPVPNVVGMSATQARLAIARAGLVANFEGNAATGRVERQKPAAGTMVPRKSTVTAYFPLETLATVPNVVGMTLSQARERLENARLTMRAEGTPAMGTVAKQDPAPGAQVKVGSAVTVTFPTEQPKVAIPSVAGMTLQKAKATIEAAGLKFQGTGEVTTGKAQSQSPPAQKLVPRGTLVTVTFARSAELVAVPNFVGQTAVTARLQASAAGLVLRFDGPTAGRVKSQTPKAGTRVERGSTVTVQCAPSQPLDAARPDPPGSRRAQDKRGEPVPQ